MKKPGLRIALAAVHVPGCFSLWRPRAGWIPYSKDGLGGPDGIKRVIPEKTCVLGNGRRHASTRPGVFMLRTRRFIPFFLVAALGASGPTPGAEDQGNHCKYPCQSFRKSFQASGVGMDR